MIQLVKLIVQSYGYCDIVKNHKLTMQVLSVCMHVYVFHTFGVEGDDTVTQRPFVHGLVEDDVLWEDDHSDVLKPAQPLQDLGHWLRLGLLHHAADPHHDLSLRGLNKGRGEQHFNGLSEEARGTMAALSHKSHTEELTVHINSYTY